MPIFGESYRASQGGEIGRRARLRIGRKALVRSYFPCTLANVCEQKRPFKTLTTSTLRQWTSRLPLGRLWYGEPNAISNAISYAKFFSRSHKAVIHVYGDADNVIETHEHKGDFKEW
jgi:hypothetical protein